MSLVTSTCATRRRVRSTLFSGGLNFLGKRVFVNNITLLSHFVLDGDVAHANLLKFALTEHNVESTTVLVSSSKII